MLLVIIINNNNKCRGMCQMAEISRRGTDCKQKRSQVGAQTEMQKSVK